jgi:hypothetical protein
MKLKEISTLEWAKWWYDRGFSVVPVHYVKPNGACSCSAADKCASPGKHPANGRWQKYQKERADHDTLEMWFDGRFKEYNLGVVTGSVSDNVFVVDVDVAEGKLGADSLDDLQMANDDLPQTLEQITGSGGRHYFFKAPAGVKITTGKNTLGEGIDTRGEGGFVVVCPSNHKSGYQYVVRDEPIEPSPDWLEKLAQLPSLGVANGVMQQNQAINRWGELADGREGFMVKLIMGTIRTWWAQRGELPTVEQLIEDAWPTFESKAIVRGSDLSSDGRGIELFTQKAKYQLSRARNGELRILDGVEPGSEQASINKNVTTLQTSGSRSLSPVDAALAAHAGKISTHEPLLLSDWTLSRYSGEPPEQEWLIENILPRRIPGLIAAIGGLGKSYILLDLAMKVAGGDQSMHQETALGGKVLHNGKVVFLGAEDSAASMHRRIAAISDPSLRIRAADNLIVVPLPDAGGPMAMIQNVMGQYSVTPEYQNIRKQLLDMQEVSLVVIDPLQAFAHADINTDPAAAQFWWTLMSELCVAINGNVLIAHHMRKEGTFTIKKSMQAREAIRGTTALIDGARWAYALWPMPESDEMVVAQKMGFEAGLGNCVMGGVVKVNDAADTTTRSFLRGESGLLSDRSMEIDQILEQSSRLDRGQINAIFTEIERRWNGEEPFAAGTNTTRSLIGYLKSDYAMTQRGARHYLQMWLDQGYIEKATHKSHSKTVGLRVVKRVEDNVYEFKGG